MAGKRGNGEGSIYRRTDRRWVGQYLVHTAKGPKYRYLYGKTRQVVAEKLTKAMADRDSGLIFDTAKMTLGDYLDRWLADSVKSTVRNSTYERHEEIVRLHIKPSLGRVGLKKLTPAHVRGLYSEKPDSGLLAPATVRKIHSTLHKALSQAVSDGIVPRKRGELLGLRWDDVNLDRGTLRVGRALVREGGRHTLGETKTKRGRRQINLTPRTVNALKAHRKNQLEGKMRLAGFYKDHGLIFASEVGTPVNPENLVKRSFKPLLKRASLPEIRFHDLRHTCATLLLGRGVHPKLVQELLGHATIAMTLDTYSHYLPSMGDQAAGAMGDALG